MQDARILVIDDDQDVLESIRMLLKQYYSSITILDSPNELLSLISRENFDLIFLDMNFRRGINDGEEGFYWLERILEINPRQIVVLITAYGDVDIAVDAIKSGAADFLLKPWNNQKLIATVHSALELSKSRQEVQKLNKLQEIVQEDEQRKSDQLLGESELMIKVRKMIAKVAASDASVLILGENGSGKDLVARALHQLSNRREEAFITVDLGAITENLFESELFGHKKGAFTDAYSDKIGRLEAANGGTVFLDEIGNIPLHIQKKLLSVIQNSEFLKVGDHHSKSLDVRWIAATNSNLDLAIKNGEFREDLFYRINTVQITIPPLRERGEDIILLADHFVRKFNIKYRKGVTGISSEAKSQLLLYNWPGNVRELMHLMERAVILSDGGELTAADFLLKENPPNELSLQDIDNFDELERRFILQKLTENGGNVTRTAEVLDMTRTAFYRRLKKYGIR